MMKLGTVLRWSGRLMATAILVLSVIIAVGEGLPDPRQLNATELYLFICLAIIMLGSLCSWFTDRLAGTMLLIGYIAFWVVAGFTPFLLWAGLAGVLLWAGYYFRKREKKHE